LIEISAFNRIHRTLIKSRTKITRNHWN